MKKIITLFFVSFYFLFVGCKKVIDLPLLNQTEATIQAIDACMKAKTLPVVPKQGIYIEGELDGKYFSISKNAHTTVRSTLGNFLAAGYQKEYAYKTEWQGNGFAAFPIFNTDSAKIAPEDHYYLSVNFPLFQGDSLEFIRYFEQFQRGNSFTFVKSLDNIPEKITSKTVSFQILLFQCENSLAEGSMLASVGIDQTNSYFKIVDVKSHSSSGIVTQRDVTIEFDVTLGAAGAGRDLRRIKNGRLFFSY